MEKECIRRETLYQLPEFFTRVAAELSEDRESPFLVSMVFFPQPEKDFIPPTSAQILAQLPITFSGLITAPRNEYGNALDKMAWSTDSEKRRVVLVFTDGTFSDEDKRREQQEIEEKLRHVRQRKNAEVYLITCHEGDSRDEAWNTPTITQMLSGVYELQNLQEWIGALGNTLFGEWLYSGEQIRGWITNSTVVTLPGETITFTAEVIPFDSPKKAEIVHKGSFLPLHEDAKVYTLERGFEHSEPGGSPCTPREIRLNLEGSVGLYLIGVYRTPPAEIQVTPSENHEPATVTFSLKASPDFEPSKFVGCYSEINLEINWKSEIANIPKQLQNSQSIPLIWRPPTKTEPGDYSGILSLKNREGRILGNFPITLSVRFRPSPSRPFRPITATTNERGDFYSLDFEYNYVPPGAQPEIFLCSLDSTEIEELNKGLSCGMGTCCTGGSDGCSIVYAAPTPCPPEVSGVCTNCVPVTFDKNEPCAGSENKYVAVVSPRFASPAPPQFTQIYTVTMFNCLARLKGYRGLVFSWPGGPNAVALINYYEKEGEYAWHLKQQ